MSILTTTAALVAPWTELLDASPVLQTGILFAHLAGVLVGGGFALVADYSTLRVARAAVGARRRRHLAVLRGTHPPVLLGLGLAVATGLLMVAADLERFGTSPAFWTKMGVIVLLLANGALLARASDRLRRQPAPGAWPPLRAAALRSIALWLAALLAGTYLLTGN